MSLRSDEHDEDWPLTDPGTTPRELAAARELIFKLEETNSDAEMLRALQGIEDGKVLKQEMRALKCGLDTLMKPLLTDHAIAMAEAPGGGLVSALLDLLHHGIRRSDKRPRHAVEMLALPRRGFGIEGTVAPRIFLGYGTTHLLRASVASLSEKEVSFEPLLRTPREERSADACVQSFRAQGGAQRRACAPAVVDSPGSALLCFALRVATLRSNATQSKAKCGRAELCVSASGSATFQAHTYSTLQRSTFQGAAAAATLPKDQLRYDYNISLAVACDAYLSMLQQRVAARTAIHCALLAVVLNGRVMLPTLASGSAEEQQKQETDVEAAATTVAESNKDGKRKRKTKPKGKGKQNPHTSRACRGPTSAEISDLAHAHAQSVLTRVLEKLVVSKLDVFGVGWKLRIALANGDWERAFRAFWLPYDREDRLRIFQYSPFMLMPILLYYSNDVVKKSVFAGYAVSLMYGALTVLFDVLGSTATMLCHPLGISLLGLLLGILLVDVVRWVAGETGMRDRVKQAYAAVQQRLIDQRYRMGRVLVNFVKVKRAPAAKARGQDGDAGDVGNRGSASPEEEMEEKKRDLEAVEAGDDKGGLFEGDLFDLYM